jgi:hypothetical protein
MKASKTVNFLQFAKAWTEKVHESATERREQSEKIYYKLPEQLENYHQRWVQQRGQNATLMNTTVMRAPITTILQNPERQAQVLPAVELPNINTQILEKSAKSDKGKGSAEIDASESTDIQMDVSFDDFNLSDIDTPIDRTVDSPMELDNSIVDMMQLNRQATMTEINIQPQISSTQVSISEEQIFIPYGSQAGTSGVLSFGHSVPQPVEQQKKACAACKKANCLNLYDCPGSGKHIWCKCVLGGLHPAAM